MALGFIPGFTGIFSLIALVPILLFEDKAFKENYKSRYVFVAAWLSFIIWNTISAWWIWNATPGGAIGTIIANSGLYAVMFWLFHISSKRFGRNWGYFSLFAFWIGFEQFYFNAEMNWPWLNLGHSFMNDTKLIQWYEYTGILGGTLWILACNLLILLFIKNYYLLRKLNTKFLASIIAIIILPILISFILFYSYTEKGKEYEVVVIQPNIDPYNEKFDSMTSDDQLSIMLNIADSLGTANTKLFLAPETSIGNNMWIGALNFHPSIIRMRELIKKFPSASYITGLDLHQMYHHSSEITPTARRIDDEHWYDSYNSAAQIDTSLNISVYHKSKLVVGVEMMPYPQYMKILDRLSIDLGGITGSRGTQKNRSVFVSPAGLKLAPVICYESVFGEFVSGYIKNGAEVICVLTNDGWWGNTFGYKQHMRFSCLRAIETRRSVVRSANTGISGFINQRGEIVKQLVWWQRGGLREKIKANSEITLYCRFGDFIGIPFKYAAFVFIAFLFFKYFKKKKA